MWSDYALTNDEEIDDIVKMLKKNGIGAWLVKGKEKEYSEDTKAESK